MTSVAAGRPGRPTIGLRAARRGARRRPGRTRLPAGLAVAVFVATAAMATATAPARADARAAGSAVAVRQRIATLLVDHRVFATPHAARSIAVVRARRPITGGPTVLPVTSRSTSATGARWLRVMVPGRPNGRRGWIQQRGTRLATTVWQLVVRTSSRRVLAYRDGRLVRTIAAVVGKPSTPTPHGAFFVEESVRVPAGSPGGPFALALSARSNVLQDFEGGPGQIGIHGVRNLGGVPGTAVSHGCVRLADAGIKWLAARIRPGVPVTITR